MNNFNQFVSVTNTVFRSNGLIGIVFGILVIAGTYELISQLSKSAANVFAICIILYMFIYYLSRD